MEETTAKGVEILRLDKMSDHYVYHICRESDVGNFSEGYIGITANPVERWTSHKGGYSGSVVVNRAYKKYDDLVESIVLEGSKELCLYTEMVLRPHSRMGWNLTEGGGYPPSAKGKIMSQRQKDRIGASQRGKLHHGWKGYWVIDGVSYESMNQASAALGCAKRTVRNRALNPDWPAWTFEESLTQPSEMTTNE